MVFVAKSKRKYAMRSEGTESRTIEEGDPVANDAKDAPRQASKANPERAELESSLERASMLKVESRAFAVNPYMDPTKTGPSTNP